MFTLDIANFVGVSLRDFCGLLQVSVQQLADTCTYDLSRVYTCVVVTCVQCVVVFVVVVVVVVVVVSLFHVVHYTLPRRIKLQNVTLVCQ